MAKASHRRRSRAKEPDEVLEQRALDLSRERPETEEEALKVVLFRIGRERAGLPAEYVREVVCPAKQPTRVPGTPDFLLGLVNLRGKIVACLDLSVLLGIESTFADSLAFMLLVAHDNVEMGIAVDEVSHVVAVPVSGIDPPSSVLSAERARFIKGIFYIEKRPLSLVDLEGLIHSDRIESLREGAT